MNVLKRILHQIEKNVCKIRVGEEQATGFFCKIPFPDLNNMLSVLITVDFIFEDTILYNKDQKISLYIMDENDIKILDLNDRIIYTNRDFSTAIIEIKETDHINYFLELDNLIIKDILYNENTNREFIDETLYTIQYGGNELSSSYGILDKINNDKKYKFIHKCSTRAGASGSPMLNLNNKVIGIHTEGYIHKYNKGTFLNYPIKEFININVKQNNEKLLKEFNKKYNLDINDFNITKLNLSRKFAGNELLKNLSKLKFNELKELYLYDNDISEIKDFQKINFEKLEILDLCNNNISDIKLFEKIN